MAQLKQNARLLGQPYFEGELEPEQGPAAAAATTNTRLARLRTNYNPKSEAYQTTATNLAHVINSSCGEIEQAKSGQNEETIDQLDPAPTSTPLTFITCNILERYTEPLSSYVFYANLFLSIMNTFLLSFLVKSLQFHGLNSFSLADGRLVWDEHLESTNLNWPVNLRSDRSLFVGSIESHGDEPLILTSMDDLFETQSTTANTAMDGVEAKARGVSDQILIRALTPVASAESNISDETNYIFLRPAQKSRHSKRRHQRQQPVEIVANSLIINQLVDAERAQQHLIPMSPSHAQAVSGHGHKRRHSSKRVAHSPGFGVWADGSQLKRQSGAANGVQALANIAARRLLELDGRRQAIVLPLMNRIDLFPSSATTLFVKRQLRSQSGFNGRLKENFDVQARWGNLSFESGRALRIVSKSNKLDLASARLLCLEAPTLKLSATKTNNVLFSAGIEFLGTDRDTPAGIIERGADSDAVPLEAFKLILVDDILMALRD